MTTTKSKKKTKQKTKSVAEENLLDFLGRMSVKDKDNFPCSEKEITSDFIRVRWNDQHETVFYEGGGWIQRDLVLRNDSYGLYPSGAGHYSEKIKRIIGEV